MKKTKNIKKLIYGIVSLVMVGTMSITAFAADTNIIPGTVNDSGGSIINMTGTTIPAPTYTVTIPEKLEFGTITKKVRTVSDTDAMANTSVQAVAVKYSNFFDNQKNLTIAVSTSNEILKGETSLAFRLYEKGENQDTEITSGTYLFSIEPSSADLNETVEKQIYAAIDQRLIKVGGDYTGTVTFTVAITDNK